MLFLGFSDSSNPSTLIYFSLILVFFVFILSYFFFFFRYLSVLCERKGVGFGGWRSMGRIWEELEEETNNQSLLYEKYLF